MITRGGSCWVGRVVGCRGEAGTFDAVWVAAEYLLPVESNGYLPLGMP